MQLSEPVHLAGWRASLALEFERRGDRTALSDRRHEGPLVVQKPLYPEGEAVCHAIVVHPPAGIAGGDELELTVSAGEGARALLTTPGAGKWYRSAGPWARQKLAFDLAPESCLEWLPQETIVFDGARAELGTSLRLAADARYIGWEILCLGRTGSGERFERGACMLRTLIERDNRPLWLERGRIDGASDLLRSPAGFAAQPVGGTLIAAAPRLDAALRDACRSIDPAQGRSSVTLLPDVLVARYLGASSEAAKRYFTSLWRLLRPALFGREAIAPRIWQT